MNLDVDNEMGADGDEPAALAKLIAKINKWEKVSLEKDCDDEANLRSLTNDVGRKPWVLMAQHRMGPNARSESNNSTPVPTPSLKLTNRRTGTVKHLGVLLVYIQAADNCTSQVR